MSNITPIRQQVVPSQQDWWFPPPCPTQPQPCPPPQQCTPPSCFSHVAQANACWDQSQALYNLVSKVVMDIFATNPGIIPQPPPGTPGSPGSGGIVGVTDGSNAQPGNVGEFFYYNASFAYADVPTHSTGVVSLGVVQPGDWNMAAFATFSTYVNGAVFQLSPIPTGATTGLQGVLGTLDTGMATTVENTFLNGIPARGNFTVPTLLAFKCDVFQPSAAGPGTGAGTMTVYVQGRRAR